MQRVRTYRGTVLAIAVVVALVAIVLPTCRMVGCSMEPGGVAPWGVQKVAGLFSDCGGEYVFGSAPYAVVPSGADALTVTLVSAVIVALALLAPSMSSHHAFIAESPPPSPPEPPLGVRLRL